MHLFTFSEKLKITRTKMMIISVFLLVVSSLAIYNVIQIKRHTKTQQSDTRDKHLIHSSVVNKSIHPAVQSQIPKHWMRFVNGSPKDNYYIITNEYADHVAQRIGTMGGYGNGPSFTSNFLPDGLGIFSLPNISPSLQCAVRLPSGKFVIATAVIINSK